jgi:hypothetical protein
LTDAEKVPLTGAVHRHSHARIYPNRQLSAHLASLFFRLQARQEPFQRRLWLGPRQREARQRITGAFSQDSIERLRAYDRTRYKYTSDADLLAIVEHILRRDDDAALAATQQTGLEINDARRFVENIRERLSPLADEAETVRSLLRQHIPSAFEPQPHQGSLTVRDAASHLQSKSRVPASDLEAHRFLLNSGEPLPAQLSLVEIKKIAVKLKVKATDFYWKRFQQSAVALWMARSQKQAQLAARSKRKSKDTNAQKSQGPRDPDSEKETDKNDAR